MWITWYRLAFWGLQWRGEAGHGEGKLGITVKLLKRSFILPFSNLLMSVPLFFIRLLHFLLGPLFYLIKPQIIRGHNMYCKNIKSRVSATLTATTGLYKKKIKNVDIKTAKCSKISNCTMNLSQYLTNLMHKICFTISFISCLYMFRAHVLETCRGMK